MNRPNHHVSRPELPDRDPVTRVQLKPDGRKTGYIDGAWWPRSTDLTAELPGLLGVLAPRLGVIDRVVFSADEWPSVPPRLLGAVAVRLDGIRRGTAHTIEVLGYRDRRQVLLIIPPRADARRACAVMARGCRPDDESTVDELLTQLQPVPTGRAAALRRWRASGAEREYGGTGGARSQRAGPVSPTPPPGRATKRPAGCAES